MAQFFARGIHYLEALNLQTHAGSGRRFGTDASFMTDACGNATIPYQIPSTTTLGIHTFNSFLNSNGHRHTEVDIEVIRPSTYLPLIIKESGKDIGNAQGVRGKNAEKDMVNRICRN